MIDERKFKLDNGVLEECSRNALFKLVREQKRFIEEFSHNKRENV